MCVSMMMRKGSDGQAHKATLLFVVVGLWLLRIERVEGVVAV